MMKLNKLPIRNIAIVVALIAIVYFFVLPAFDVELFEGTPRQEKKINRAINKIVKDFKRVRDCRDLKDSFEEKIVNLFKANSDYEEHIKQRLAEAMLKATPPPKDDSEDTPNLKSAVRDINKLLKEGGFKSENQEVESNDNVTKTANKPKNYLTKMRRSPDSIKLYEFMP